VYSPGAEGWRDVSACPMIIARTRLPQSEIDPRDRYEMPANARRPTQPDNPLIFTGGSPLQGRRTHAITPIYPGTDSRNRDPPNQVPSCKQWL